MNRSQHLALIRQQHPEETFAQHATRLAYREKHFQRRAQRDKWHRAIQRAERALPWLIAMGVILLVLFRATSHAQSTNLNMNVDRVGGVKQSTDTLKVNCVSGCSASSSPSFGSTFPATGTAIGVKNGASMVNLAADGSSNLLVNCAVGCAGGSSTPSDAFANPTTAGLNLGFSMVWNGTSWSRLYGDTTNGAFVNIKNSVPLAVTGTFWQSTQPVSIALMPSTPVTGTFWQTTQPVSSTQLPAALDGSGFLKVHEQGTASVSVSNFPATQPVSGAVDVSDRAARLLGVVYGSQAQQLKQTATNFNLQTELATGGTLYDARQTRALTSSDVVSVADNTQIGATVALGALNATCSVSLKGNNGAGMFLAAGTLVGTITPEISYDGGTTWIASIFFDALHNTVVPTVVFGSSNTATSLTVMAGNGVSDLRVRVSVFTSGTANCTMRATNSDAQLVVNTAIDGKKTTYAAATGATATAGTGVVLQIQGSSTKTVRVTRIHVTGFAATAAQATFKVQRTSVAATAGTSAALTSGKFDINDPAATAVVTHWTATGGTTGTTVGGPIISDSAWLPSSTFAAAVASEADRAWTFGTQPGTHELVLRGTADFATLTCSGTLAASQVSVEWTEE